MIYTDNKYCGEYLVFPFYKSAINFWNKYATLYLQQDEAERSFAFTDFFESWLLLSSWQAKYSAGMEQLDVNTTSWQIEIK